jgi:hypothetical protein
VVVTSSCHAERVCCFVFMLGGPSDFDLVRVCNGAALEAAAGLEFRLRNPLCDPKPN